MNEILLEGGLILDPGAKKEVRGDLLIRDGKIVAGKPSKR
jgi:predicted amidohydrolase